MRCPAASPGNHRRVPPGAGRGSPLRPGSSPGSGRDRGDDPGPVRLAHHDEAPDPRRRGRGGGLRAAAVLLRWPGPARWPWPCRPWCRPPRPPRRPRTRTSPSAAASRWPPRWAWRVVTHVARPGRPISGLPDLVAAVLVIAAEAAHRAGASRPRPATRHRLAAGAGRRAEAEQARGSPRRGRPSAPGSPARRDHVLADRLSPLLPGRRRDPAPPHAPPEQVAGAAGVVAPARTRRSTSSEVITVLREDEVPAAASSASGRTAGAGRLPRLVEESRTLGPASSGTTVPDPAALPGAAGRPRTGCRGRTDRCAQDAPGE